MYIALALGTLVKGLAGLVLPGMIMFFYLFFTRKWQLLREFHLSTGAVIYLALTAPWYAWAGAENPGYLRYYLWEEHFNRFWTDEFKRSQGWYYYFLVLAVGFLPWTPVLPLTIRRLWRTMDDKNLFLAVWAAIPFIFFSASNSKLPHYLLPVYPALAILTAQTIVAAFSSAATASRPLFFVWAVCAALLLYLALGTIAPDLVTWRIRGSVEQSRVAIGLGTVLVLIAYGLFASWHRNRDRAGQRRAFICTGFTLSVLFIIILQLQDLLSLTRSARAVAQAIAPEVRETTLVLYNTYPTGLIFYLRLSRPAWLVPARKKSPILDSPYLEYTQAKSSPRFGKILMTTEEFSRVWPNIHGTVRVLVKESQLTQFHEQTGATTRPLLKVGEYFLVTREHDAAPQALR
jgi:4-amino-4-deoxy-L-arabinose transferase-like glycosyltransferase